MDYASVSYRYFGSFNETVKPYFFDMKEQLQRANMNYTTDEWISMALFTTFLTFFVECISISFILGLIAINPIASMLLGFTLSLGISAGLFFMFVSYPSTTANSRESKIRKVIPFSVSYMATISSSRLPPIVMFKTLAKFTDYGEIANEAANITRDVETFGMTFAASIKKQARRTPSKDFRELLWGLNSVVASGANVTYFLKGKSEELMNDYRRSIRKYANDLSLFVEVYLTLIITGSIFFIVLSSIIAAISGGTGIVILQSFVVFILLPLLSIGFIIIIKSMSPTE